MKSIKPGRGPSGMSFMGAVFAVVFGIFWTVLAAAMTSGTGLIGIIFPLFGVIFIIQGVINAAYHYKNATGKNRFSTFDITADGEEGDPADSWVKREIEEERGGQAPRQDASGGFCPWCGTALKGDFRFCPGCGREQPRK